MGAPHADLHTRAKNHWKHKYYGDYCGSYKPDDLVPIRRFPRTENGEKFISKPADVDPSRPVDPVEKRVIACGLRRTSPLQ